MKNPSPIACHYSPFTPARPLSQSRTANLSQTRPASHFAVCRNVPEGRAEIPLPAAVAFRYTLYCAAVVVEGATVTSFVTEASTMLVIGLILSMFGIGLFCWLIFTLAVYALPFFIGLTAGMAAFHSGAGVLGALLVGMVTGAITLAIGQIAFAVVRPPVLRAVIAAAFAVPAAIAGYHVLGLSQIGVPSLIWREVIAWIGALFIGCTAWARMTVFAEPLPLRPSGTLQNNSQPVLTGATRQG
jgi:hypothetical protein